MSGKETAPGNKHYENTQSGVHEQGFIAPQTGNSGMKSEARQQDETDLEPISKPSSGRTVDGDTEFKQQQSKQADAAKDHGAASLASEKEKLQKDVLSANPDAAANRAGN